jgi:hypothetical protein
LTGPAGEPFRHHTLDGNERPPPPPPRLDHDLSQRQKSSRQPPSRLGEIIPESPGDIISESWAASSRFTRAASSESAACSAGGAGSGRRLPFLQPPDPKTSDRISEGSPQLAVFLFVLLAAVHGSAIVKGFGCRPNE